MEKTFDGATFNQRLDGARLTRQHDKVFDLMADGQWHTLSAISRSTGEPEQSVSARLRDMRKRTHGGHTVERRRVEPGRRGIFQYRLIINKKGSTQ